MKRLSRCLAEIKRFGNLFLFYTQNNKSVQRSTEPRQTRHTKYKHSATHYFIPSLEDATVNACIIKNEKNVWFEKYN